MCYAARLDLESCTRASEACEEVIAFSTRVPRKFLEITLEEPFNWEESFLRLKMEPNLFQLGAPAPDGHGSPGVSTTLSTALNRE
jgi:hypothetical protein